MHGKDESILHYYEKKGQEINTFSESVKKLLDANSSLLSPDVSLNSVEVSQDSEMVYFGGTSLNPASMLRQPVLYACTFDSTLRLIDKLVSEDNDLGIPVVMKRFPGYEILAIGCAKHVLITNFQNNKLSRVKKIENVHPEFSIDLAINHNTIYSKGLKDSCIRIIKFIPYNLNTSTLTTVSDIGAVNHPSPTQTIPPPSSSIHPLPKTFAPIRYSEYKQKNYQLEVSGMLEKVTINRNGTVLYTGGGTGCNILKLDSLSHNYIQVKNEHISKVCCFGIKSTKSGHLLVQEPTTNDLLVLKSSGQEIYRYSAAVKFSFRSLLSPSRYIHTKSALLRRK